eukprot:m.577364 g.577364  ORF g.577364 m.577364 type:complete len:136 (+) comp57909_c0_seq2:1964-2371(+)
MVLDRIRHITIDNTLCKSFHDRCLANAWFANEDWIVLRAAGKDLESASNFLIATNHRIHFALACSQGHINPKLLQRLSFRHGFRIDPGVWRLRKSAHSEATCTHQSPHSLGSHPARLCLRGFADGVVASAEIATS